MKKQKDKVFIIVFFAFSCFIMLLAVMFGVSNPSKYVGINRDSISYERARVTAVKSQEITVNHEGIKHGVQELEIEFLSGAHKGTTSHVENRLTARHSIFVKEGQKIVVCVDQPDETYFIATVFNYDRTASIAAIVVVFLILLIGLGGSKGWRSAFGLLFTFVLLIFFLIPMIAMGYSPVAVSVATIIPIVSVSLISLCGFSRKTAVAVIASGSGVVLSGILFLLMGNLLRITGYNTEEVETLVVVARGTGLRIRDLLFGGVLISCLGAVMDIAVSVASSVAEIHSINPSISRKRLFLSGYRIARDITGTMANTLILAFTGGFLITLLLFWIYNMQFLQLINLDVIAIEIAVALSGTIALVLTAPLTAFIAASFYSEQH